MNAGVGPKLFTVGIVGTMCKTGDWTSQGAQMQKEKASTVLSPGARPWERGLPLSSMRSALQWSHFTGKETEALVT